MDKPDKLSGREILVTLGLIALFGALWARWPSIKVSSKTLESYKQTTGLEQSWTNGIGTTIKVRYLQDPSALDPDLQPFKDLVQKYLAFDVSVSIEGATYPTMLDIPYERTTLALANGVVLSPGNQELAEHSNDLNVRQVLENFDWSIVNNTFTRQPRFERGLILFDPSRWKGEAVTLNLDIYHHPYKRIKLAFRFDGQKDGRATGVPGNN